MLLQEGLSGDQHVKNSLPSGMTALRGADSLLPARLTALTTKVYSLQLSLSEIFNIM